MSSFNVRELMLKRLTEDLIGPMSPLEVLISRPSDVYMTGILFPLDSRMDYADDDGAVGESEDDDSESTATVIGQNRPCTMGVSFTCESKEKSTEIKVEYSFGLYRASVNPNASRISDLQWVRTEINDSIIVDLNVGVIQTIPIVLENPTLQVEIHVRTLSRDGKKIGTVTLINRSKVESPDRQLIEESSLFQTSLRLSSSPGTIFVPMPDLRAAQDLDEQSVRLLYRDCQIFAYGHQCSCSWSGSGNDLVISSEWIPRQSVESYSSQGHEVFNSLISSGKLSSKWLATASTQEVCNALVDLCAAYESWIHNQELIIHRLTNNELATSLRHKETWLELLDRMRSGVRALSEDENLLLSFKWANQAMAWQHSWKKGPDGNPLSDLQWRPFQIGFLLLSLESSIDPKHKDRETLDLLWFPTGGGKTEAYLALIAVVAFYRRLTASTPSDGCGNVALMRYTLRLLTSQQFARASSLILACEKIRKTETNMEKLGSIPFSIGLWVGRDATPNSFEKAQEAKSSRLGVTAEQITHCYCCNTRLNWIYDEANQNVHPRCEASDCDLGPSFGMWPIATVDSDIYRIRPTLVIGTIDKFAQMPFKPEMASLFGAGTNQTPDLVIQDELHLISGPLGTIAGLYETAFDWLIQRNGCRAKVIGSTATIRRAEEQIRALFDRKSFQFPPPGLSYQDSGFAVVDNQVEGRLYVGVTTAGRSAKFVTQAVAGSLLQSVNHDIAFEAKDYDGYSTLLMYFNSLRELGGAIVQVLDDVPDSMLLYASKRGEKSREIDAPRELTSHVSQKDIVRTLEELSLTCESSESIDAVLATNMVSVGVDVPRLGLMLVNGQPKTRSEYIQSTSRVGRSNFPGLVVCVMNAMKGRDRSHYETFVSWHQTIYRDVEATSVTPFASRARDRCLRTVLVSMIRHGDLKMRDKPDLTQASSEVLSQIVSEIERRISSISPDELEDAKNEIDEALEEWMTRSAAKEVSRYLGSDPKQLRTSLLQTAELAAQRSAAGNLPGRAWPTLNTMRSVEASTEFRLVEGLSADPLRSRKSTAGESERLKPWRKSE
jgi:hypothetical protein